MQTKTLQNAALTIGLIGFLLLAVGRTPGSEDTKGNQMTFNKLTPEEERVIVNKGTEPPFTGMYYNFHEAGTYTCKRCGAPLFKSSNKFESNCGWPSFDDAIPGAVIQKLDADGSRTEITCANCGAHLGHVFVGEGFTPRDTRHCVNSISLNFIPADTTTTADTAYFAGGCFWGVEYYLEKAEGVLSVRSGYMGGHVAAPSYEQVCSGTTGHAEAVEVAFDPSKISYEQLTKLFFEIHDPTEVNRQGPDVGEQYRSAIFYRNDSQKQTTEKLIEILQSKGYKIATELAKADKFWPAEDYHQDYYSRTGKYPYCHAYQKRF
jgi:peptide methionine sulfoxide reductase msrA/msrB